jgi:hypothetical protein
MENTEKFRVVDGDLYINESKILLTRPVDKALLVSNKVIFLYVVDGETFDNRNIGAFDEKANLLWLIEESCPKETFNEYYKMYVNDDGELVARIWAGQEFTIDLETGKRLKPYRFVK